MKLVLKETSYTCTGSTYNERSVQTRKQHRIENHHIKLHCIFEDGQCNTKSGQLLVHPHDKSPAQFNIHFSYDMPFRLLKRDADYILSFRSKRLLKHAS